MSVNPGRYDIFQAARYCFALETGRIIRVEAWPAPVESGPGDGFDLVDSGGADPIMVCPLSGQRGRLPMAISLGAPAPARLIVDALVAVNLLPGGVTPAGADFVHFTGLAFVRAVLQWPHGEALLIDPASLIDSFRSRRHNEHSS